MPPRRFILNLFLILGCAILVIEIVSVLPITLERWRPFDYGQYVEMGRAVLQGVNPNGTHNYYPLPTILWVFVPLALLPDGFRILWVLGPLVSILVLFRKQGLVLFLFVPLWLVVSDGMLDGWLLLPLAVLLTNRPGWAGFCAAIVLFKPQLAFLAVAYKIVEWLILKDWKNLGIFFSAMAIFYAPAFIINPNWIMQMLQFLPGRLAQTTTLAPALSGSIWAWWSLGGWASVMGVFLLVITLGLFLRAFEYSSKRATALLLLGLAINPVLFGSNQTLLLPVLQNRRQMILVVLISLGALLLDKMAGNFGGGYALIPITMLYFQRVGKQQ